MKEPTNVAQSCSNPEHLHRTLAEWALQTPHQAGVQAYTRPPQLQSAVLNLHRLGILVCATLPHVAPASVRILPSEVLRKFGSSILPSRSLSPKSCHIVGAIST